jgi:hypothetical protein
MEAVQNFVIPGRGRSPRARNPCTRALPVLPKPVFMASGPGPSGRPGMTNSIVISE